MYLFIFNLQFDKIFDLNISNNFSISISIYVYREYNDSRSPGFCEQRFQDRIVRQGGPEISLFQRTLEISGTSKNYLIIHYFFLFLFFFEIN